MAVRAAASRPGHDGFRMTPIRSNSQMLNDRLTITCGVLTSQFSATWEPPDLSRTVPSVFTLLHQIVRASVPLMELASSVAAQRADVDPVCRHLQPYLATHAIEERDHDEWLWQDFETAGIPREEILGQIPAPNVAALVGAQYYWVQHHHPVALLGYMRVLEGNPPSISHVELLERKSKLPRALFRTYRLHGELDPDHIREMDSFIDSLPLADWQADLMWISATHTARALAASLADLDRGVSGVVGESY